MLKKRKLSNSINYSWWSKIGLSCIHKVICTNEEVTWKNNGDLYALNCSRSCRTKKQKRFSCVNHKYCEIVMPNTNKNTKVMSRGKNQ